MKFSSSYVSYQVTMKNGWLIYLCIYLGTPAPYRQICSLQYPTTVTEPIKYAETADAALRASQKPYVTGNSTAGS